MEDKPRLLHISGLKTHFKTPEGTLQAVVDVSLDMHEGEILGVLGESGCGKSVTAASVMRILPPNGRIAGGAILYRDRDGEMIDLARLKRTGRQIRAIRGDDIAMVFQEPMTSFSPVHSIGDQVSEALLVHRSMGRAKAEREAIEMLRRVGMPKPEETFRAYPFELSGGMRQRAMIAMALVCRPRLLIADEPTTALDVTIEAQVLELMRELQRTMGMAIMVITHDSSVVAAISRNVVIMYLGQDVEYAPVEEIFAAAKHPYTRELLASVPRLGQKSRAKLHTIKGAVPSLYERPGGCPFHPRCRDCIRGKCDTASPPVVELGNTHRVRCFLYAGRDGAGTIDCASCADGQTTAWVNGPEETGGSG